MSAFRGDRTCPPLGGSPSQRGSKASASENVHGTEEGHASGGGGGGAGEERSNTGESSMCTSECGNSGLESNTEGGERWCGGSGGEGGWSSKSNASRRQAGGQQKCNVAYMYDGTDGGEDRSGMDSSEQEEGDGCERDTEDSEMESSDDGMGDSSSVADITECLDFIGDVSRQRPLS